MKRIGHLFERLVEWPNLLLAAKNSRRGKRFRIDVAEFDFNRESHLIQIQSLLTAETWQPAPYRSFHIHDPKTRLISAAPYPDRVVHHALCQVIQPAFERSFISDSYACRKARGTHAAVRRAATFARHHAYVMKADVARFFASIDHEILLDRVSRRIKDRRINELVQRIVRHPFPGQEAPRWLPGDNLLTPIGRAVGLPLGNQTSQFLANVMLDPLDHFVKEKLQRRGYVRYADDLLVFGNSASEMHEVRRQIEDFVIGLRLRLHPRKTNVFPTRTGIPFLGFRIFPSIILLGRPHIRRLRKRLVEMQRLFHQRKMGHAEVQAKIISWWGHAKHADARKLTMQILSDFPFVRGDMNQQE